MNAVFDIEADGLLDEVTKIHCVSYTTDGKEFCSLTDYDSMRDFFINATSLIGHDIHRYDLRVVKKILGVEVRCKTYDTLFTSWYINHSRSKHGLESFGEDFGIPKPKIDDWQNLTLEEYVHRCTEDVKINWSLWQQLIKKLMFLYKDKKEVDRVLQYLTFKAKCAAYQEDVGFDLDLDLVHKSIKILTQQQEEKYAELVKVMPPRKLYKKQSKPKNLFKKDGTPSAAGQRWFDTLDALGLDRTHEEDVKVPNGEEPANPGSSDQVKDWLFSLGWEPCTYKYEKNEDGSERLIPQVRKDGELTESVKILIDENPSVEVLDGLTVIQHRLGVFEGFRDSQVDGKIHATVAGLTNTLRFKHAKPVVNLPGVDKPWGKEIRGSLIAPKGKLVCGADMVSLEDTTKRHYMYHYDPDYVEEMNAPGFDPHLDLAKFAGVVTQEQIDKHNSGEISLKAVRKNYKAANYASIYGVGGLKLSRTLGIPKNEAQALIDAYWERNWSIKKFSEEQTIRKIGGEMWVLNPVSKFWISLRYEKDVFSSVNQSTGVFCFDSWLAQCWVRGLKPSLQMHDEGGWLVKVGEEDSTRSLLKEAIDAVNKKVQLNVQLDVDIKFGNSYAETH